MAGCALTAYTKGQLPGWIATAAKKQGHLPPDIILGINDDKARDAMDAGRDFIFLDHAYFRRGWERGNFRAVRSEVHLTRILPRPADRLEKYGVTIEPWRRTGTEIIVIPPSERQQAVYRCAGWTDRMLQQLDAITERPVRVKWGKFSSLREWLADAWAVVTYASVAGVEATLMGVPVFGTPRCPSWPVCAGPIERIETPDYSEARHEWACSLAYASWHMDELNEVQWKDYQYGRCGS